MERMLGAELTEHLGYEPHGEPTSEQTNRRNGAAKLRQRLVGGAGSNTRAGSGSLLSAAYPGSVPPDRRS
jgi:hypothetical protein